MRRRSPYRNQSLSALTLKASALALPQVSLSAWILKALSSTRLKVARATAAISALSSMNEELARAFVAAGVVAQASSSQGNGGEGVGTLTDAVANSTTIEPVRLGVLAAAMAAEDIASDEASSSSWRPVSGHGGASEPSPVRLTAGRNSGLVVRGTSQNPNFNEKSRLFDDQAAGRQPPSAVSQLRDNLPPAAHGFSPFKQLRREAGGFMTHSESDASRSPYVRMYTVA